MEKTPAVPPIPTRDALLDAAERVFAERGFDAASLRDVTDAAGVAHGLIRHHFASKEGLWRAVLDRAIDRYRAAMAPHAGAPKNGNAGAQENGNAGAPEKAGAPGNAGDPLAATRAAARGFLEVSMRHPEVVRLMLHEGVRGGSRLEYLLGRYLPMASTMAPLFERARRAGHLRGFDQPSMFLFMLTAGAAPFALPALSAGVLGRRLDPGSKESERHINRILDTLLGPEAGRPGAGEAKAGRPGAGGAKARRSGAGRPGAGRPEAGRPEAP